MHGVSFDGKFNQPRFIFEESKDGGKITREVIVKVETEMTDDVAAGISEYARSCRQAMIDGESNGGEKLDIRNVKGDLVLEVDASGHRFKDVRGIRAVTKLVKGKREETSDESYPVVRFEFQMKWSQDDVLALAHCFGTTHPCVLERTQQEIA